MRNWGQSTLKARNPEPIILLRADTDALPVQENTGAPYHSVHDGVMHACGHDMHITTLLAAVRLLADIRDHWTGTLIACFQPCEETGTGAQAMVDGGLYADPDKVPTPQFVFGGHISPELAGTVSLTHGTAYARSDSWKATFKGRGGHASRPEACIDPVVMAAFAITRLQTVVSRVVPSTSLGVLTVGEIHAGKKSNIIPNDAYITINMRADSDDLAGKMEAEMKNIIEAEVKASIPEYREIEDNPTPPNPEFERLLYAPLLENKEPTATDIASVFQSVFGEDFNGFASIVPSSEDFQVLALCNDKTKEIPYCYWRYGGTSLEKWEEAGGDVNLVPSNHSDNFLPQNDPEADNDPLKSGTKAMCAAALSKFNLVGLENIEISSTV
ncbi:amidohydrolase [Lindgomyces ingoldianus]|uniref:Amidohydrolase n=1 Tax=Lindgomyces ingoldianus TaxID=673940 RepID=A0ACB6Q7Q3_9PLEO|nr:amidohydrolase [Lindgomyces ingoldianus]KAF2462840.1 amidohydrolase [Lindgomyces ingoldianus]